MNAKASETGIKNHKNHLTYKKTINKIPSARPLMSILSEVLSESAEYRLRLRPPGNAQNSLCGPP